MKLLKTLTKLTFLFSALVCLFFLFFKIPLPAFNTISSGLYSGDPLQTPINKDPYLWKVGDQTYKITPLYDYEIRGLVVSDYDANNWLDYTHKNDPAQTKDLCLIWGSNLTNGVYQKLQYDHGEFTCFVKWSAAESSQFNQSQLSNNHLIPTTPVLKNLIKNSQIGDQVYIRGQLVNYELLDKNNQVISIRTTSIVREDHGCEVILVSDFKSLGHPPIPFLQIKSAFSTLLLASGLLNILLFLFF